MTTVALTGSCGFIGGYVAEELLRRGFHVVGIDNYSKYGKVEKSYDSHPNYRFVEGDVIPVRAWARTPGAHISRGWRRTSGRSGPYAIWRLVPASGSSGASRRRTASWGYA